MKTILTLDKANQPYGFQQLNGNGNFDSVIIESGLTANTLVLTGLTQSLTDSNVLSINNSGVIHTYPLSGLTGGTGGVTSLTAGTGLSGDSTTGAINLINTSPDQTVVITGGTNIEIVSNYPNFGINFTGSTSSSGNYLPLSGGTVTGNTIFQSGLTASTISATTYNNLPNTLYTGNGSLSSARTVNLNGNNLTFSSSTAGTILNLRSSSGYVGIGTSGPFSPLHVSASTNPVTFEGLQSQNETKFIVSDANGTLFYRTDILTTGSTINAVTGGSYSNGTLYLSGTGLFLSGITGFSTSASGAYLPLSGGTVTGATSFNSGLTANTIYTNYIDFNTNSTPINNEGRLIWNNSDEIGGLEVTMMSGNTVLQIGEENLARVYNADSITLTAGTVVYVFGSQGNTISIKRASNTGETTSSRVLGVVSEPIISGQRGFIQTFGLIKGLDTSSYSGGTPIWLGSTPGSWTSTEPTAPQHTVLIGFISRATTSPNGSIFIHISNGWELNELHNVDAPNPSNNDVLMYSASTSVWVNSNNLVMNGITATTLSAGTYQNLPTYISATTLSSANVLSVTAGGGSPNTSTVNAVTGGTYSNGTITLSGTGSVNGNTITGLGSLTPTTLYSGDGTLSGNRTVNLGGFSLNFSGSSASNNLYLSGGNVGIGTNSPQYTLDVSGNTRISGDTLINGITVGRGKGNYITNTIFGVGSMSGTNLFTGGANNTVMGYLALSSSNVIGGQSVIIGSQAHPNGVSTSNSVIIGYQSAYSGNSNGNSVIIGALAGYTNSGGTGNVFIGYQAGYNDTSAVNKLYISNSQTNNLIYGEFNNGRVGINTTSLSNAFTVSAATDPVKFIGLQSASDSSLLTVDGSGVVHTVSKSSVGLTWNNSVSPLTASTNNGYITTASTTTTISLPSTASIGTTIEIAGNGTGFWILQQQSGQSIRFGNTATTVTTGVLSATSQGDCVRLLCTTENTGFQVLSSIGNIFYS